MSLFCVESRGRWCAQYCKLLFNDKVAPLAAATLASKTKTTLCCSTNKDWPNDSWSVATAKDGSCLMTLSEQCAYIDWSKVQSHRFAVSSVCVCAQRWTLPFIGISDAVEGNFDR